MMKYMRHDNIGNSGTRAKLDEESQIHTMQTANLTLQTTHLMERVCSPENLNAAYKRVIANKGSAGVDQMEVTRLLEWLVENKNGLIRQLMEETYDPRPIRRAEIPKPSGGIRKLGIPTVVDRLIQQAILQVLSPILDTGFSQFSYGFRPGRSAHDALKQAKEYVQEGRTTVVDIDIEKFFDYVNHDKLMNLMARKIEDKRILRLIRKYLKAGVMVNGVCMPTNEGTPQGGPLSPLLSNVMLHELDRELEKRGHKFCRYADDCNIYVYTIAAGERVLESITKWLEKKLKLKINEAKSAVSPSRETKVPGLPNLIDWHPKDLY